VPSSGWIAGWCKRGSARRQELFEDDDAFLQWAIRQVEAGYDVYFAPASFTLGRVEAQHRGRKPRGHDNVDKVRSLWLDIDTRESHEKAHYATRADAWEAVVAFCRVARLPLPLFVSSGGGLHCYWPLDEELDLASWQTLAIALKRLCMQHQLHADPARTADSSSVLRLPGTVHWKTNRLVEIGESAGPFPLSAFEHLKAEHEPTVRSSVHSVTAKTNGRLLGRLYNDVPSHPDAVTQHCQQLGALANDPSGFAEPVHYAAAGLYAHCRGGPEFFRHISHGYRQQDDATTEQWCDDAIARAGPHGPTTCAKFESVNPGGCDGCRHKGTITSPIILGRGYGNALPEKPTTRERSEGTNGNGTGSEAPRASTKVNGHKVNGHTFPQAQSEIELPGLWKLHDGQLILLHEDHAGTGEFDIVADHSIYLAGIHEAETTKKCTYVWAQHHPTTGWRNISTDAGAMWNGRGFSDLADGGAAIRDAKLFTAFMKDSVKKYLGEHMLAKKYEQMGWKDKTSFLVGRSLYTANEVVSHCIGTEEIMTRAQFLGPVEGADVREWVRIHSELYAPENHGAQLATLCSFGAPLMHLVSATEGGCILALVDPRPGTGKSAALRTACSVWGRMEGLAITSRDTAVAQGLTLSAIGNLPVIFDEVGLLYNPKHPERLRDFVMGYGQGENRKTGLQHGEGIRHVAGRWANIMITASNDSIMDQLDLDSRIDASQYRLLEVKMQNPVYTDHTWGDHLEAELAKHAGAPGHAFLQHLLQPEVMSYVKQALKNWTEWLWQSSGLGAEHRFRIRLLACAAVAGDIMQQLGLTQITPQDTIVWALNSIKRGIDQREPTLAGHGMEAFSAFLDAHWGNTLVVARAWQPRAAQMANENPRFFGPLKIRFERETRRLYTPMREFKQWLVRQGYNFDSVMEAMEMAGVVKNRKRNITLGAGTQMPSGQSTCLELDMAHPAMQHYLSVVEVPNVDTGT
jgi:Domain of unknown function (DUF927)